MTRLFIAIRPPQPALDHLAQATANLDPTSLKIVPDENLHITLVFLGQVPSGYIPELCKTLDQVSDTSGRQLKLQLSGAGHFRNDSLWIGVRECPNRWLTELTNEVNQAIENSPLDARNLRNHEPRHRKFKAHLTVARQRKGGDVDLSEISHALSVYQGEEWPANDFSLFSSELGAGRGGAPRYEEIQRFSYNPNYWNYR